MFKSIFFSLDEWIPKWIRPRRTIVSFTIIFNKAIDNVLVMLVKHACLKELNLTMRKESEFFSVGKSSASNLKKMLMEEVVEDFLLFLRK